MKNRIFGTIIAAVFAVFAFAASAFASPYIGVNADVNHGNTQAVIGVDNLVSVFGIEGTHLTNYVLPTQATVCGYDKNENKTCTTNETSGIKNTVAVTAKLPITDRLSGVLKAGAGNGSKTYLAGAGISYRALSRLDLKAEVVGYQISGDRRYVPTIGASFSF